VKALQEENAKLRDALQNSRAMEAKLRKKVDLLLSSTEATEEENAQNAEKVTKLEAKLKRMKTERQVEKMKRQAQGQLPLNRQLMAVNVIDGAVPESVIVDARQLYETHVKPYLDADREEVQVRWESAVKEGISHTFFALSPSEKKWKYHIDWVYPNDLPTRSCFQTLFDGLQVKGWFKERLGGLGIDIDTDVAMYAASFVVRTGAKEIPYWHTDYEWWFDEEEEDSGSPPAKQAYTLMTPLEPMDRFEDGHLLYKDIADQSQVYKYEYGKAVCFGSGFEHATQPSKSTEVKAFLCFTFGTDKFEKYWSKYLEPPLGPPLGSQEFTTMVYEHLGINASCSTGFETVKPDNATTQIITEI